MAKRKSPVKEEVLTPELVIEQPTPPQAKFELRVDMDNLVQMVRTEARDALMAQRTKALAALDEAKCTASELQKKITKQATDLVQSWLTLPKVATVLEAMHNFNGYAYKAALTDQRCDLDKENVTADLVIQSQYTSGYRHGEWNNLISSEESQPFSAEMQTTLGEIKAHAVVVRAAQAALDEVNRYLADLPNMAERAEAALTRAYLGGELKTGSTILDALSSVKGQAHPMLTRS